MLTRREALAATALLLVNISLLLSLFLALARSRFQMTAWKELAKEPADTAEQHVQ